MKILKNAILLLISSAFVLGFSCERCEISAELLLTEPQKNNNPFKGSEKIIFREDGSIIEFSGTYRFNWIDEVPESLYSCDYSLYEQDNTKFINENYEISLLMNGRYDFALRIEDISNDFKMRSFLKMDQATGELSDYQEFLSTLYINNTEYNDVYKDTLTKSGLDPIPDSVKYAVNIYYSTDYGIIKVDFSDGSTWELQEIIWQE